ncbi:MAG TPA: polysaccharide biosynthesis tyrosine autokinase, partial [Candidatus Cloacimonadota bacterium]|nr:polysaccharide biosynthesis tyrosine autokinase [Candidatus Cloacimonadota bacterium]
MENQQLNQINQDEIKLSDYLRIILQYRYLVVVVFALVIAATIIYTARQPKVYSAASRILLEDQKGNAQMLFMAAPGVGTNSLNNQIELMKSKPIGNRAWEIMKKNPEWESFPINQARNPGTILKSAMKVESKRETDILTISMESTNQVEAMAAVNAIAEAIQQENTQYARLEFTTIREFLETQLDAISRRLQSSENDLREFKNLNKLTQLSEETSKLIEQSADVEANYESALTDQAVKAKTLVVLQQQLAEQDSLLTDVQNVLSAPRVEELRKQVVGLQTTITKLQIKDPLIYDSGHPQIKALNDELQQAEEELRKEINVLLKIRANSDPLATRSELFGKIIQSNLELEMARAQVDGLKSTKEMYDERIITLPNTELELARLTRNMMLDGKIHDMMMEKYEDAKIAEQAKVGNIRIIEYAEKPNVPIKPRVSMNILVGLILGLGLGIGAAFLVHSLDTKLRTLEDMENYVRLPIVGTIPMIQESESRIEEFNDLIERAEGENKEQLMKSMHFVMMQLISHYAPKSPIAESYRTLRTNILAKKPEGSTTMLITSSGPKEGKSTSIVNLSITLAQMNSRVVLIDMDMRRPMIHNKFGIEKENGVSDYLIDPEVRVEQVIKQSGIVNLDVITSGFVPPNPSELISSYRTDKLIQELKERYDFILFDTPPIIAVTDALILTKKVDMTFVVVRCGYTEKGIIKRTKELMENIDSKIDG